MNNITAIKIASNNQIISNGSLDKSLEKLEIDPETDFAIKIWMQQFMNNMYSDDCPFSVTRKNEW